MCADLDSSLKCIFVRGGKHTTDHGVYPHMNSIVENIAKTVFQHNVYSLLNGKERKYVGITFNG